VLEGNLEQVRSILNAQPSERLPSVVNATREDGATPLVLAIRQGSLAVVSILLKYFADPTICASGWSYDAPPNVLDDITGFDDLHLRRVRGNASPLMIAVATAFLSGDARNIRDNRIIRAIVFCGAMAAPPLESEDAEEELQNLATIALTAQEEAMFVSGEGNAAELEAIGDELLGFNPFDELRMLRMPWLAHESEPTSVTDESLEPNARHEAQTRAPRTSHDCSCWLLLTPAAVGCRRRCWLLQAASASCWPLPTAVL
jgi:hypothetical protein